MNGDTEYDELFDAAAPPPRTALFNRPPALLPTPSGRFLPMLHNTRPYQVQDLLRTGEA